MNLHKCYLTKNLCYTTGTPMAPKGIIVHSTGCNNPWLKRYVQPDDGLLGVNTYGTDWNQPKPGGRKVCVHAMIGKLKDGTIALTVSGADMVNGTPVLDVKPYVKHADCIPDAISGYADEFEAYTLKVVVSEDIKKKIPKELLSPIIECLKDDPRPSYQEDGKIYGMTYQNLNVKFVVKDGVLNIIDVK